jgi:hypothetical protein
MSEEEAQKQRMERFGATLNSHGYSFQAAVITLAKQLYEGGMNQSLWKFRAAEFPVEVREKPTRIDLIMEHRLKPIHMVVECKRVNPAYSSWCFVSAPIIGGDSMPTIITERMSRMNNSKLEQMPFGVSAKPYLYNKQRLYNIVIEVKTEKKGDQNGGKLDVCEEAATQVCRGMNGYIETLLERRELWGGGDAVEIFPVIFTTAEIYVSDVNLTLTDVTTGEIDLTETKLTQMPWVMYQYHMSPGLKHSKQTFSLSRRRPSLQTIMEDEFVRMIPVVSANGIQDFLKWASEYPWDD